MRLIVTMRNATPPTLPISSPNKRKNVTRPSPNLVSLNTRRPLVKKKLNFATPLWFAKVKVPKNVKPFMNQTAKLDIMSMTLKTMLLNAKKSLTKNAKMLLKVTLLSKSVANGPGPNVPKPPYLSKNTHPRPNVKRLPDNFADLVAVFPNLAQRNVSIERRLSSPR